MNAKTLNRPTFWGTLLALTLACTATQAAPLSGAGSSFVFPVISIWGFDYSGGNSFSYEPSGSGSGIKAVEARKVLFAASDEPLTQAELVEKRLVQFPLVMGAVVPAVNLPGFATQDFKLTGPVLADLFRGKITRWNAPEIAALNPGITLPDLAVKVIHRTEGSGTTWVFTDYLTKVSPAWADSIGTGKKVVWPVGEAQAGNKGVATAIAATPGAIGYTELGTAKAKRLGLPQLQNRDGNFVAPTHEAVQAAANHADWNNAPGLFMVLNDQPGAQSWPITAVTYALIPTDEAPSQVKQVLDFFERTLHEGNRTATALQYIPIPETVMPTIQTVWKDKLGY
ncbi:MAG: phosphate ABC transporter substrate-binding protein PstS [Alphaproteobacteria bacterium CG_4_10_14_0_2_um_filter_63_37]|nr:MAG: phosphate ABC transporter substrate-binding protein PstS [Proteobacteria bacterium CG1_02_64_396]PJA23679.1 MAG: phosphate ABC transporter substrate-binding protein PstS [Alphaproteobacteria bacterium CG_4_10_14_0_2_um_filter_63_37]